MTHASSHFSLHLMLLFLFWLLRALVQVINSQLVFSVTRGSTRPVRLRLDQVLVADGRWHDLQLELRDVHSDRETRYVATLRLDFGLYQVKLSFYQRFIRLDRLEIPCKQLLEFDFFSRSIEIPSFCHCV